MGAANPFGLHRVLGNVREWCADVYAPDSYRIAPDDGAAIAAPGVRGARRPRRVVRGAAYSDTFRDARSAARRSAFPTLADERIGLRPARALEP